MISGVHKNTNGAIARQGSYCKLKKAERAVLNNNKWQEAKDNYWAGGGEDALTLTEETAGSGADPPFL